jgi:hypothetical protein
MPDDTRPGDSRIAWDDSDRPDHGGFMTLRDGDPRNAELEAKWWARIRAQVGDEATERMQHSHGLSRNPRPLTDAEAAILWDAVAPLLRDMDATGQTRPDIRADAHEHRGADGLCGWIQEPDGRCGQGITVWLNCARADQLWYLAGQFQDWAGDGQYDPARRPWPECPDHPGTHPLEPEVLEQVAVWYCPRTLQVVADIGALASPRSGGGSRYIQREAD